MAHLARITVYPIKSLPGVSVESCPSLPCGALANDRRFALRNAEGEVITAKRTPLVHHLRAAFDLAAHRVSLEIDGRNDCRMFRLNEDHAALEAWLSEYFGMPLSLVENLDGGWPDDTESPGPTVVSTATLETVASWFPNFTIDEVRERFRANLDIDGVEPFWEDRLYGAAGEAVEFQIGTLRLAGTNPCQRCVVPSRSPWTGEVVSPFAKVFGRLREEALPAWATASRFDHYYRLATNTRAVETARQTIHVGDEVRVP